MAGTRGRSRRAVRRRERLNEETGKGFDHQICLPWRGNTPRSLNTLPRLQSFMTAWDEPVQDVQGPTAPGLLRLFDARHAGSL